MPRPVNKRTLDARDFWLLARRDNAVWQVHEAKARFSEFLAASVAEGPQIVTKRGVQAAVLVPIEEWRRLAKVAKPSLKYLLLAPGARTEALVPAREIHSLRPPPALE